MLQGRGRLRRGVYHLPDCSITRDRIARLTTHAWVEVRESPVITSESGGAKSYVARALGAETCRRLTSVRHARPDDMFRDLNVAHSGGRIYGALDRFSKQPAHPGDFFTTSTENQLNAIDLFKMLEVREGRGSTMFASQPEPNRWYPRISSGSYADSMLSCAVGHVRVLNIKGSNMRECAASLKAEANKGLLGLTTAPILQKVGTASRGGRSVFIGRQY